MNPWRGVEHLDREIAAAELVDGCLIIFALLLRAGLVRALLVGTICLMARKQNPPNIRGYDENQDRRVQKRVLERAFLRGLVF